MHILSDMHAQRIILKPVPGIFIDFEMKHNEGICKLPRIVEVSLKLISIKIFYGKGDVTHQILLPATLVAATITRILVVIHHLLVTFNQRLGASILHASPKRVHRVCVEKWQVCRGHRREKPAKGALHNLYPRKPENGAGFSEQRDPLGDYRSTWGLGESRNVNMTKLILLYPFVAELSLFKLKYVICRQGRADRQQRCLVLRYTSPNLGSQWAFIRCKFVQIFQ
mgnify:CR=1 FL=1